MARGENSLRRQTSPDHHVVDPEAGTKMVKGSAEAGNKGNN